MLRRGRDEPPAVWSLYTRAMFRMLAVVTIALALAACGLKGDLYLPPEPPPAAAPDGAPAAVDDSVAPTEGDGDPRRQPPPAPDRGQAQ